MQKSEDDAPQPKKSSQDKKRAKKARRQARTQGRRNAEQEAQARIGRINDHARNSIFSEEASDETQNWLGENEWGGNDHHGYHALEDTARRQVHEGDLFRAAESMRVAGARRSFHDQQAQEKDIREGDTPEKQETRRRHQVATDRVRARAASIQRHLGIARQAEDGE